jgi:hypothetical protein
MPSWPLLAPIRHGLCTACHGMGLYTAPDYSVRVRVDVHRAGFRPSIAANLPVAEPSTRRLHPQFHARRTAKKGELDEPMLARDSAQPDDQQASTLSPIASRPWPGS